MTAVQKHVVHMTKQKLNDTLRRTASGSSFIKFEAKPLGNPSFRWIALGI
jgi:hypothetical protein